jgi:hypothetical protein
MARPRSPWLPLIALPLIVACGSDGGGATELDPGRKVAGCFDCEASEYCIMIDDGADAAYCAPNTCNGDCDCMMDDAAARHAECSSSCQDGSGLVYCKAP